MLMWQQASKILWNDNELAQGNLIAHISVAF